MVSWIRIRIKSGKLDPDPHRSGKMDPDPHQSERKDPDLHPSEKEEAWSFWSTGPEGPNLEKSE